jgi:protein-L-isoaspartate(D-aspartate) O-methyltransferase
MAYEKERSGMVKHQIEERGIHNSRVLKVMLEVPRHLFVPKGMEAHAYDDNPLSIGHGQTISQPYIVALMTELLELSGKEKVLEIGAGSGYQAAILSRLAKKVMTIERVKELAEKTGKFLKKQGYSNVKVVHGDGTKGYAKEAPYDAIIVTAAAEKLPPALKEQLKVGGRLVAPVGPSFNQELIKIRKIGKDKYNAQSFGGVIFVPLIAEN